VDQLVIRCRKGGLCTKQTGQWPCKILVGNNDGFKQKNVAPVLARECGSWPVTRAAFNQKSLDAKQLIFDTSILFISKYKYK
jgi:hypothetical protein